ncbi:MAG: rod shape-determining protein RodA [Bacteroidia bacterium]|nr:rod shape-determining protein RodA [Bacteroidia bacterium]
MTKAGTPIFRGIDVITFSIMISLSAMGWFMIFAVGYGESGYPDSIPLFLKTQAGKQAIFLGVATILFLSILIVDWKFWRTFSNPIYLGTILLLVLVLVFGTEIKGARSWFHIFGFSIQPSELAKFGTCLAVSDYLATVKITASSRRALFYSALIFGVPALLILLQPDAGSALIFGSFVFVLFRNGLSPSFVLVTLYVITLLIAGIITPIPSLLFALLLLGNLVIAYSMKNRLVWMGLYVLILASSLLVFNLDYHLEAILANAGLLVISMIFYWRETSYDLPITVLGLITVGLLFAASSNFTFNNFLKPHQQDRINVWLQPEKCDPHGSLYNLIQSRVAIGSGGFAGKGFLNGSMTRLNYIPEQSTDFIFSSIGEEHGFLGSIVVIGLFMVLIWRIILLAEKQRSLFSRNYAYCVAGILFTHIVINIGMTMGLFPIIGIPLPFISYGGSSLLGFTLMIGVLLKLDQNLKSV